jgi:ABC-type phosphate transport system permease subunit
MSSRSLQFVLHLLVVLSGLAVGLAAMKIYLHRRAGRLERTVVLRLVGAVLAGLAVPVVGAFGVRYGTPILVLGVALAVGALTLAISSGSIRDLLT